MASAGEDELTIIRIDSYQISSTDQCRQNECCVTKASEILAKQATEVPIFSDFPPKGMKS